MPLLIQDIWGDIDFEILYLIMKNKKGPCSFLSSFKNIYFIAKYRTVSKCMILRKTQGHLRF